MKAYSVAVVTAVGLLVGVSSAGAAAPKLDVYDGTIQSAQLQEILDLGVDRHELEIEAVEGDGAKDQVRVETILSAGQAAALRREGLALQTKQVDGQSVAERATALGADGHEVFRQYGGPGGLLEDFRQTARENRRITKLVTIGRTVNDQEIVALKISRDARKMRDGRKPSVLYLGAQHAREWITPEMIRRLKDEILARYDQGNPRVRRLVNRNELWFVPVANPDGYDFTLRRGPAAVAQEPARQRRRRRDHRRRRRRPQPQLRLPLGLRQRGLLARTSRARPTAGRAATRSPRPKRSTASCGRVGFEFFVNYHSAAELLLYGIGWQVATPSPDDVLYEAMAGDDADPAVPGLRPRHLGRALHDQRRHRHVHAGALRHPGVHAGDVDLRSGLGRRPRRRVGGRGLRQRLRVPRRRGAGAAGVREEHPVRAVGRRRRPTTRTTRSRRSGARPRTSASIRSTCPTATRRPWPSWPSGRCGDVQLNYKVADQRVRTVEAREWARRRALRRRERRLLRRAAGRRARRRRGRPRTGLLQRLREARPR